MGASVPSLHNDNTAWCPLFAAKFASQCDPTTLFSELFLSVSMFALHTQNVGQTYKSRRYFIKNQAFSPWRPKTFHYPPLRQAALNFGLDLPLLGNLTMNMIDHKAIQITVRIAPKDPEMSENIFDAKIIMNIISALLGNKNITFSNILPRDIILTSPNVHVLSAPWACP